MSDTFTYCLECKMEVEPMFIEDITGKIVPLINFGWCSGCEKPVEFNKQTSTLNVEYEKGDDTNE